MTNPRWTALGALWAALLACGWSSRLPAADFALTADETARIERREIVIRAKLDGGARRGTVRAALLIDAAPAVVFRQMTRCEDALEYVPHLKLCRVRSRAADGTWELVDHEVDFGWYAPRIRYTFRADLVPDLAIRFRQDHGDFKANEGVWEFESVGAGARTLLRYRAFIDPPSFVPNWLARSKFKREMPQMLTDLRLRCEAEQRAQGQTSGR